MRELDDALEALSEFESLVRYGLYPGKSLEKVEHRNKWDLFNFACLEFRAGELRVEANAHGTYRNGYLNALVWDFNKSPSDALRLAMGADVEHVARVVVDYINGYEATV